MNYEVYAEKKSLKTSGPKHRAIVLLDESTDKLRVFVGLGAKGVEVLTLPQDKFTKQYVGLMWGGELFDPKVAASELIMTQTKFSTAALDNIERILNMDTRGKSTEQIRQEIVRIVGDLPEGHPLRTVPKTFPDRSQAIAAYTAVRKVIFSNSNKGNATMGTKKVGAAAAAAAAGEAAAPAATETTKGGKKAAAKKTVAAAEGAAPAAAETAAPAGKGGKASKAATALAADGKKKAGRAPNAALEGPFKLTKVATDAKEPSGLRMHEGSARFKLMEYAMKRKSVKPFTLAEATEAAGEDGVRQALSVCMKLGYIVKA